tara:strand:+ start:1416 stop:2726 length:1311 start_codon:yes stop_codon:yes gene_type:complete
MSTHDFVLPAASQTLAVSRTNWNGGMNAIIQCFYGTQLPAATDVNDEGTTGLKNGMLYRDSANSALYIRDSASYKGTSGHLGGNFTRVGIGTRVVRTLGSAATLAGGHTNFSAFEVGELLCTVGNSAGSANNRLYLKTANTATGIADVSIPPDGGIGVAKLNFDAAVSADVNFTMRNLFAQADNTYDIGGPTVAFKNLYLNTKILSDSALAIGDAGLSVTGSITTTGTLGTATGSAGVPAHTFTGDTNTGIYRNAADSMGFTTGGTNRFYINNSGLFPEASVTYDIGSTALRLDDIWATNFQGTATSALYADLAERFEADEVLEEGDVVMIGGDKEITKTDRESTPEVFGVISTKPAFAMNAEVGSNETHPYVALAGRLPVKVVGKVLKGQRLVASSQPGIAIAAETKNIFAVVGRALESSDELGVKLIEAAVGKL